MSKEIFDTSIFNANNSWAENEIKLMLKRNEKLDITDEEALSLDENKLVLGLYGAILKTYNEFSAYAHSGFTVKFAQSILNRLIDFKPLTPLEDTEDAWTEMTQTNKDSEAGRKSYQNKRMTSLFKRVEPDGSIHFSDVNRCACLTVPDKNSTEAQLNQGTYHSGMVTKVIDEIMPIEMPYVPDSVPILVFCNDFVVDPTNGDFDTMAIFSARLPDGRQLKIDKYYRFENGVAPIEISESEYEDRYKNRYIAPQPKTETAECNHEHCDCNHSNCKCADSKCENDVMCDCEKSQPKAD